MFRVISSIGIWIAEFLLILIWLPFLGIIYLLDRDPVKYKTGRWFRRLGVAMTKVNPNWKLKIDGATITNPRNPYVLVCNHQSMADIPFISHLPWEMKWVAKKELFDIPFVGWMMKMAGDIPVDRKAKSRRSKPLIESLSYLKNKCSVMFFPEGTRSLNGKVHRFNEGAFLLAVKAGIPILPLAIDGSHDCLPKKSWIFQSSQVIKLRLLEPIQTQNLTRDDVDELTETVRQSIINQIAEWRGVDPSDVDAMRRKSQVKNVSSK